MLYKCIVFVIVIIIMYSIPQTFLDTSPEITEYERKENMATSNDGIITDLSANYFSGLSMVYKISENFETKKFPEQKGTSSKKLS